jgi:hypothetical protein
MGIRTLRSVLRCQTARRWRRFIMPPSGISVPLPRRFPPRAPTSVVRRVLGIGKSFENVKPGAPELRHSREMTRVCSARMTRRCTKVVHLARGQRGVLAPAERGLPIALPLARSWHSRYSRRFLLENESVTRRRRG